MPITHSSGEISKLVTELIVPFANQPDYWVPEIELHPQLNENLKTLKLAFPKANAIVGLFEMEVSLDYFAHCLNFDILYLIRGIMAKAGQMKSLKFSYKIRVVTEPFSSTCGNIVKNQKHEVDTFFDTCRADRRFSNIKSFRELSCTGVNEFALFRAEMDSTLGHLQILFTPNRN
jgi:hypothetical protein